MDADEFVDDKRLADAFATGFKKGCSDGFGEGLALGLLKGHQVASRVGFMQALVEAQAAIAGFDVLAATSSSTHGALSADALGAQSAAFAALCSSFPLENERAQELSPVAAAASAAAEALASSRVCACEAPTDHAVAAGGAGVPTRGALVAEAPGAGSPDAAAGGDAAGERGVDMVARLDALTSKAKALLARASTARLLAPSQLMTLADPATAVSAAAAAARSPRPDGGSPDAGDAAASAGGGGDLSF